MQLNEPSTPFKPGRRLAALGLALLLGACQAGGTGAMQPRSGAADRQPAGVAARSGADGPSGQAARVQVRGEPQQIALLLPLSGRAQQAGIAVRDGFLSAYYQASPGVRPRIRLYDVAARDVASAYLAAVTEGADAVVGPLTREEVAALARVADGRATTLALNFLAEGAVTPQRFYQFALSPEDEAREVARRVIADGRPRGVALVPEGEWGQRVLAAFSAELVAGGGALVDKHVYPTGTADFEQILVDLLGQGGPGKADLAAARRVDAQFIFMPGQPVQGRLVRPQLKFQRIGDLPAYATSEVYEPSPAANADLNGVMFPEMPWMSGIDPGLASLREQIERLWPDRTSRRGRLYAMGVDAYRLIGDLHSLRNPLATPMAGMTGRLSVDKGRRIRRDLDWVQVRSGQPRLLGAPGAPAAGQ
ncbi:MAG: penicillin-binding protein activator [Steroidobacteraceae bacterium]|nr:penicillin-binding protein activator [Steroidobacteraceae bacterium]MCC7199107.1 penicillin-binding protein activator [Gammaproteobacteria bacterium]